MKKTFRTFSILLIAVLVLSTSCNDKLQKLDEGSVNEYIFPYLKFQKAEDGKSATAVVVAGAKLNTVKIPAELEDLHVKEFIGFEDPEDAASVKEIIIGSQNTVITDEALKQAINLEKVKVERTQEIQYWGKLPVLEKDGSCFVGWFAGGIPIEEGDAMDPSNPVAVPVWKEHEYTYHKGIAPSCTESGTLGYWECEACGKKFATDEGKLSDVITDIVLPPLGHEIVEVPESKRTCTEDGYFHHWKCTVCDSVFSDSEGKHEIDPSTLVDKALGHELVHVEAKVPTCTEKGFEEYWYCTVCNRTFADPQGNVEADIVELPMKEHTFSGEWKKDEKYHWHECTVCHEADSKIPHEWKEEILMPPTPMEKGQKKVYCEVCGKSYLEDIPATGHEYRKVRDVMPTCVDRGYTIYEDLVTHEQFYSDYVDPLGHDLSYVEAVDSTCTEHGTIAHYHCARCNRNFTSITANIELSDVSRPLAPHQYEMKHDELGHWYECSVCHAEKENSRKPHELLSGKLHQKSAATCKDHAVYFKYCSCGYVSSETFEDVAGGYAPHKFVHKDAAAATCTEKGNSEYWVCSVCGKLFADSDGKTETTLEEIAIPAKGHTFGGYVKVDEDNHQAFCSVCNERYGELLPHEEGEGYEIDGANGHYHICKHCHEAYGNLIAHNIDYVSDGEDSHHLECFDCHYKVPGSTEPHQWTAYGAGEFICEKCGAVKKTDSSGGGFDVVETNYDPEGHIELVERNGNACRFRFVNDNAKYCPDETLTFSWSVNGEEILAGKGSGFTEFEYLAAEKRSYLIDCMFIHERGGGGSNSISVTGYGD